MHELFAQVLTQKDLSKAGDLFSLDDQEIEKDLADILRAIQEIAESEDYNISDNNQSVVEICITRVTTAIRETESIENNSEALVSLLKICIDHNLEPSSKEEDPPHAKIASDVMSCLFVHYNKRHVMELTLPVVVQFLTCDNHELSRNVSSYLSLAAVDNSDILALHIKLVITSVIQGNTTLTRVLPQMHRHNSQPLLDTIPDLIKLLNICEPPERVSLMELFGLVAKDNPKLFEAHVSTLCQYLSYGLLSTLILNILVEICPVNSQALDKQLTEIKAVVETQSATLQQVGKIVGAVGLLDESHARSSVSYLVSQLASGEHSAQPIVLEEIRTLCQKHPTLLSEHIQSVEANTHSSSSAVKLMVQEIKEEHIRNSGEKEMRSVSSQTEGNVTIITVGNPSSPDPPSPIMEQKLVIRHQIPNVRPVSTFIPSTVNPQHSKKNARMSTYSMKDSPLISSQVSDRATSSAFTVANNVGRASALYPAKPRDGVQTFCEKHMKTIRNYINALSTTIPMPSKCCVVNGRQKRYLKLNFLCTRQTDQCLYNHIYFTTDTKMPKSWIHLMFLAIQAKASTALSQQDQGVSALKACWDAMKTERQFENFSTLVTSSFPSVKDQDALQRELCSVRFFDVFEYNSTENLWSCFVCNHPEKMSGLFQDGSPVMSGQLKEKKGKWKLFKRWKTRYFTLSGASITYNKSDSRKETLQISKIQSVKAARRGNRDIPRAFEIFTGDQTYIFKAKDKHNAEQWMQYLQIAVARSHKQEKATISRSESIRVERASLYNMKDTKL